MFNSNKIQDLEDKLGLFKERIISLEDEVWKLKNPFLFKVGDKVSIYKPPLTEYSKEIKGIGIITEQEYGPSGWSHFGDRVTKRYSVYMDDIKHTVHVNESYLSHVQDKRKR